MGSIFSNLDAVPKILSYGISGLCLLLILMAFWLIREEQKRKGEPRIGIVRMIYVFMSINFLNIIIVGLIGIPTLGRNESLSKSAKLLEMASDSLSQQVSIKNLELNTLSAGQTFSSLNSWAIPADDSSFLQASDNYVASLDSLAISYERAGYPAKDTIANEIGRIRNYFQVLNAPDVTVANRKMAQQNLFKSSFVVKSIIDDPAKMKARQ